MVNLLLLGEGNARFKATFCVANLPDLLFLKDIILGPICTATPPTPYPSPKSGRPATQYWFGTKAFPAMTELHALWYVWDIGRGTFVKILPYNIEELITPLAFAHWFMGDGYWCNTKRTAFICTDNFTHEEVLRLISLLHHNFGIDATTQQRRVNGTICWRICIYRDNVTQLRTVLKPHMIPSMMYKLGI
jgi:hypothetical protein